MGFQTFLEAGEFLRVGGGGAIIVAHMRVADGGTGFECLMSGFDLFGYGDRNGGIVGLLRNRARDGDTYDARIL